MRDSVKVKTIVENFDFLSKIKVLCIEANDDVEIYFYGTCFDCPYWVADLYLDSDANGEALFLGSEENEDTGELEKYLGIYVREGKYS